VSSSCGSSSDPCAVNTDCYSCTAGASCGWCIGAATCHTGTSGGPDDGSCTSLDWAWSSFYCP
jgi:hypothetical protein